VRSAAAPSQSGRPTGWMARIRGGASRPRSTDAPRAVLRKSEARSSRTRPHSSRSLKDQHFLVKFVCVCSRSVRRKLWPGVSLAMWTAVERAGTCPGCRSLTLMGPRFRGRPERNPVGSTVTGVLPLDQQRLLRAAAPLIGAVRTRTRAKRKRSGSDEPSRHVMVRQVWFGKLSASCLARTRRAVADDARP